MNNDWKYLSETEQFLADVNKEIEAIRDDISDITIVLNPTEQVLREYLVNVGKVEGLKYLKEYIERIDNEQDETILRENESKSY